MAGKGEFEYAPELVKEEWEAFTLEVSTRADQVDTEKWKHFTPQFLDTATRGFDISGTLKVAEERRTLYQAHKIEQLEGHIEIPSQGMPATIFPIGDIHFGSVFTNDKLWLHIKDEIMETPGAYIIFMSNEVDNAIPAKFPAEMLRNSLRPDEQFKAMQTWIKEMDEKGKVLGAVTSDCHGGWAEAVAGIDSYRLLYGYEGRKFPVLENGGILHIAFGEQNYAFGLWHKQGPFNSRFNPEHALRQNRRLYHEGLTDGEFGAHFHNTASSMSYEGAKSHMKPVTWIRVGTFKGVPMVLGEEEFITDKWIADKAGVTGQMPGASVTIWDNRHVMDNTMDFGTAIEKHMALRTFALIREMGLEEKFARLMK